MKFLDIPTPPNLSLANATGSDVSAMNLSGMYVHASGTFTAATVIEGRSSYRAGPASASLGPYYTMASFTSASLFPLTGLATEVRCRIVSGSAGTMQLSLIGIGESQ